MITFQPLDSTLSLRDLKEYPEIVRTYLRIELKLDTNLLL